MSAGHPGHRKTLYERNLARDIVLYTRNVLRVLRYRNLHRGKRCFIIGNGPSLAAMDLGRLRGEITFGLNRIYLMYEQLGFATTYLVAVNRHVLEQFSGEIAGQPNVKFLNWYHRKYYAWQDDLHFIRPGAEEIFSPNPVTRGVWEGATVTYVAMQLAYFMGVSQVVLIGVDHAFQSKGEPHRVVLSEGPDPNHFHPGYFGKGVTWQLPDLETSEKAYAMADAAFRADGREIVDATVGGKLQIFRKVRYEDLL